MELKDALRPIVRELVQEVLGQLSQPSPADLRVRAGLTRKELMVMVPRLTEATLSRYESGAITNLNHPSVVRQAKIIARAVGVEFSEYVKAMKGVAHVEDRKQQNNEKGFADCRSRSGGNR